MLSLLCVFYCLYCDMCFVFISFCIFLTPIYGLFSALLWIRAGKTNSIARKIYNLTIVGFLLRTFVYRKYKSIPFWLCTLIFLRKHKSAFFSCFPDMYIFFLDVTWGIGAFFVLFGLFRDLVIRYSMVSMPPWGVRIGSFCLWREKRKRGW